MRFDDHVLLGLILAPPISCHFFIDCRPKLWVCQAFVSNSRPPIDKIPLTVRFSLSKLNRDRLFLQLVPGVHHSYRVVPYSTDRNSRDGGWNPPGIHLVQMRSYPDVCKGTNAADKGE